MYLEKSEFADKREVLPKNGLHFFLDLFLVLCLLFSRKQMESGVLYFRTRLPGPSPPEH